MGYTTDFEGEFILNRPVDGETYNLLVGLATTRRMKRNMEGYGIEGEFYIGNLKPETIVNINVPPRTQPGLWCGWLIDEGKQKIMWDFGEKFYEYIEWLRYIIEKILEPRGYILKGKVHWRGEKRNDIGTIFVHKNAI